MSSSLVSALALMLVLPLLALLGVDSTRRLADLMPEPVRSTSSSWKARETPPLP
jgi:hypothetical protein